MALNARAVPHRIENILFARRRNPHGKLPYVVWDGEGLEDSSAIARAIDERATGGPRLVPSDAPLAAEAHVLEDWADESLYFHAVYAKFADAEGWRGTRERLASMMPAAIRAIGVRVTRAETLAKLRHQGILRRDARLVDQELERHLDALDLRLSDGRRYLVGETLTIADIAVTPMLAQLTIGMTPRYGAKIASRPSLARYLARVREETGT